MRIGLFVVDRASARSLCVWNVLKICCSAGDNLTLYVGLPCRLK